MSDKPISEGRRRAIKLALGAIVAAPFANTLLRSPARAAFPAGTLYGSNVRPLDVVDADWPAAFRRISDMFGVPVSPLKTGGLPVVRYFGKTLPPWKGYDFSAIPFSTHIICSFRYPNFNRAAFDTWVKTIPDERKGKVIVIYEPEPEDEIEANKRNPDTFYNQKHLWWVQGQMRDSINLYGGGRTSDPWIRNASCLMGWTLNSAPPPNGSGRNWRDYVNLKAMNILLWDPYNHQVTNGHIRLDTGEKMFGPCASESAKVGKPWGIAEFGTPIEPRDKWIYPIEEIANWFDKLADFARAPGKDPVTGQSRYPAKYVCYWNDQVSGKNYRLEDYRVLQEAWGCCVQGGKNCMT